MEDKEPPRLRLIDFCNIKEWDIETISGLYKSQLEQGSDSGPNDIISNCKTRHDKQHKYILVENEQAKTLQEHIPETFILPSQPEFQKLWDCLKKSQDEYRGFLDSCIKGDLDLSYLNKLIKDVRDPEPAFFPMYLASAKKEEMELLKWNPMFRIMNHGECIEDTIDIEIINTILAHQLMQQVGQKPIFSTVKRCLNPECHIYFIGRRPKTKFCSDKCRYDHDNSRKKETGYLKKYMSEHRSAGEYFPSPKRYKP
ncbi:unnamed protein product [marine sediment metagenome]|uniref:Uncharacterized protein n=1 Tax=marine sediment metagenome TaxID=412755 RepID=X1GLD5_9ZZZZ